MPRRKKTDEPIEQIRKIKTPGMIAGMKDVLPADHKYWRYILSAGEQLAHDFRFVRVDTPLLEKFELYNHTFGRSNPAVKKDLVWFQDRSDKAVLRPEHTPGLARSFVEHSMFNKIPPNKFWYSGDVFSQGKVHDSKYRQAREIGFEVYGEKSPGVDAELVVMLYQTFEQIGLTPQVRVNSLGCINCRTEYARALAGFLKSKRSLVCAECRGLTPKEPLKFLNCLSQKCVKVIDEAPQTIDFLCEECHAHLFKLLETLDELGVNYVLDSRMIRDKYYYNGTIYDIVLANQVAADGGKSKAQLSTAMVLAQGGRQNYLTEMIGGPAMPAAGIKFMAEKIIAVIKEHKLEIPAERAPHVFLAQLSEQAKRQAMGFLNKLRAEDLRVVANFSKDSLKAQLDEAAKIRARVILIMGQREVVDGTIIIRDVESGIQEVININKVIDEIKKKLEYKGKAGR